MPGKRHSDWDNIGVHCPVAFGIWHLAFGTWHLAFGIWPLHRCHRCHTPAWVIFMQAEGGTHIKYYAGQEAL